MLAGLFFCAAALMSGCKGQDTKNDSRAVNDTARTTNTKEADVAITLPVLDALFYEDGFEAELKSKLQLTDEQVRKLKTASSASVADLSEGGTDYLGSARQASARSREQIVTILGENKAAQLFRLVADRYGNGEIDGLFPTQPNAVPSDTRIVVNAPAFRMDIFQEGKLLKTYQVGIGYPEFPLPTGMRRAETVIFNPTWTPPDEPWVKGKVQAGQKVAAGSKLNPLGPIKIPIGLPSLIHGGKAAAKLGNFASHGCVGLTNEQVQDFAMMLSQLAGTGLSADSIQGFAKNKTKTKTVKLDKAIPVELRYETIVADNGVLHIYRDVYERGTNTLENAKRVLAVYDVKYESLTAPEKAALSNALNEMDRDAQGNQIAGTAVTNDTAADNTDEKDEAAITKKERAKKGKVTTKVVGQKVIDVPIAMLRGKGYPVPVNYDSGNKATEVNNTAGQRATANY